ncbi:PREDICTED: pentatricopeptide repeat-containing protein At2g27800, mitochondrial-like isoform X2 [Camelina sativa]|uniref:Pentatricopeptide repeat-containing protein At2g27800, mitochondrial-like isoform X2 n=1 Tax=Camelina sativa TaxID=90675 RepID=A0ABM0SYE1_CAMSA|nr:PREDICTED: pentatricopeptide repeat-containing protein At2g27800, mitochondrial-like isoform X2 [Camelina sativa]
MVLTRSTFLGSIFRTIKARVLISPKASLSLPNPNSTSSRFYTCSSPRIEGSVLSFLPQELSIHRRFCGVIASTSQVLLGRSSSVSMYIQYSTSIPTRSLRRRISNRKKSSMKPVLNESKFQETVSKLPPRFTPEELTDAITLEEDPFLCFHLFNWASQQPRFKHENCSYHIAIRKLGAAKMYKEMDDIVNQVLSVRHIGNENLYNSIIFYFTKAGKLIRAVNIFRHMVTSKNLECRPTIRTYHILFKALLGRGNNSYTSHMYMETVRSLFRQMVDSGIEPDVFALNCLVKGYVLSLHVNDALRIFHQMSVVYSCQPNSFTYDYLIHGLCAQGRTINARELFNEMKGKGFVPNGKSYNSLVSALALSGEIDDAVNCLWEMIENGRLVDFITYRTLVDESCRNGKYNEATGLLEMLRDKKLVDRDSYEKLVTVLHKDM